MNYKDIQAKFTNNARYIANLAATFLSQSISALSVLILTPLLLRSLGAVDFGIYGVILNVVVFSTVFDFGLNMGMLKRVIENRNGQNELINTVFFFFSGFLLLSVPFCYGLFEAGVITIKGSSWIFALLSAILICENVLILFFDVLIQTANKIFLARVIRVGKLLLELGCLWVMAGYHSVVLLLAVSIAVNLLYILVLFVYAGKEVHFSLAWRFFNARLLWNHMVYSCWYFFNSIAAVLVFNTQILLLNRFADAASIAKYLVVARFFDIIRMGIANFMAVLFPTLALTQAAGDWAAIRKRFFASLQQSGLLAFFIMLITMVVVRPFFIRWSQFNDTEITYMFVAYGIFIFFIAIDNISATFLSALKLNKLPTIVSIVQGIAGLALMLILLPKHGIPGAIAASIIALLGTSFLFNPYYLLKMIHQKIALPESGMEKTS